MPPSPPTLTLLHAQCEALDRPRNNHIESTPPSHHKHSGQSGPRSELSTPGPPTHGTNRSLFISAFMASRSLWLSCSNKSWISRWTFFWAGLDVGAMDTVDGAPSLARWSDKVRIRRLTEVSMLRVCFK